MSKQSLEWYHKNKDRVGKQKRDEYIRNRDRYRAKSKEWQVSIRSRLLSLLGGSCKCCGEARRTMLEIDHINNDGNIHRRSRGGWSLYTDILKMKDPEKFVQLLCSNCNRSKQFNSGICEHKTEPIEAYGWCR